MNILIIHNGYPIGKHTGECVRTLNMAISLKKIGHSVTLLCLYSVIKFRFQKFVKKEKGITIISLPTFPISHFLKIGLLYNRFIVWCIVKQRKIDAIQAEITWSSSVAGFVKNIPLITDFHSDLVPELDFMNKSDAFKKKARKDNLYALKNSDRIICVSDILHKNLCRTYNADFLPCILPCNVDFSLFSEEKLSKRKAFRAKYNLEDKIVLCYLGGTHQWQCLNETFDIVQRLHCLDDRYYFCLFTQGDLIPYADKITKLDGCFMTMPLKRDDLVEHLSMIDAGFLIRDNMLLNANSSPTKTAEYMACGAMVITTKYAGDAPSLIEGCNGGFVLDSICPSDEEIEKLHRYILSYKENYENRSILIRDYVGKNRSWNYNELKLKDLYAQLI